MSDKGDEAAFPQVSTDSRFDPPDISSVGGLTKRELIMSLGMLGVIIHSGPVRALSYRDTVEAIVDGYFAALDAGKGE